jgi:NitT/TauT family transport system substrate-binding protein
MTLACPFFAIEAQLMNSDRKPAQLGQKHSRRTALKIVAGATIATNTLFIPWVAKAATKIRVQTNFYPEPAHGGFYQALLTGLYSKSGLDVEIRPGGPQVNGMQLLTGGEADVLMGASIAALSAVDRGVPITVIMANFQADPQVIVTRPDVQSLADLKGRKILVTTLGRASYWLWLKKKYGFTDDQVGAYTGNFQSFIADPTLALGGVVTSEPFHIRKAGAEVKYFLLAKEGYPPYGYPMMAMRPFINSNKEALATFVRASIEGWKSFHNDPTPTLSEVKKLRPDATDEWLSYAVATMKELKFLNGGDAEKGGIGIMTDARWKDLADFMISADMIKPTTDWKSAYTTEFVKDLKITV